MICQLFVYLIQNDRINEQEEDIDIRNLKMSMTTNEQMSTEEYSTSGDRSLQFERGSSQNSRTSSMAESTEGFSNYTEIIQHLQTIWNHHNNINDNSRRSTNDETIPSSSSSSSSSHPKSSSHYHHSQQGHYSHHQNWSNYNNPRRSGGNPNYSRTYHDGYWNSRGSRFPTHRSVNSLMNNSNNYQQQQQQQQQQQTSQPSPPTQRRPNDLQQQYDHQPYYKKDRRANGYHSQHSTDSTSEQSSSASATQSFPNQLNSFNR